MMNDDPEKEKKRKSKSISMEKFDEMADSGENQPNHQHIDEGECNDDTGLEDDCDDEKHKTVKKIKYNTQDLEGDPFVIEQDGGHDDREDSFDEKFRSGIITPPGRQGRAITFE